MTSAEFKKWLSSEKFSPLVFFLGEEFYALEESIKLLSNVILEPAGRDFNYHQFSGGEAEIDEVLNAVRTIPFMAQKRMVLLRNIQEIPADSLPAFLQYLQNPSPETILLMTANRWEKKNRLFKFLEKEADWVEFKKPREYQLPELTRRKAKDRGYVLSPEALELFCQRSGTDQNCLHGELEKLFNFAGEKKKIEVEDVSAAISQCAEANIFGFLNATGRRDLPEVILRLQGLMADGANSLFILTMLVRHFRQIWTTRSLRTQGVSPGAIPGKAGFNQYFLDSMVKQAEKYSASELRYIFELFLETDTTLKTSASNSGAVLENLLLQVVGCR